MLRSKKRPGLSRRSLAVGLAVLMLGVASTLPVFGDKPERIDADSARRLEDLKDAAGSYKIERESDPPVGLKLVAEPALRWNNPLRVAYDGAMFIWVADGRPEVVSSFYRNVERGRTLEHHEFQSLSESGLSAIREGREVWRPRLPGVKFKPIPGAPAPGADAAGRLRQLRGLAREFHAGYATEDNSKGLSLRMLTKPLYRYESSRADYVDGALFAFVQATDPEVVLLIESRPGGGAREWHYSFAPMSGRGLRGWHKDELVWEVPVLSPGAQSPYMTITTPVRPN